MFIYKLVIYFLLVQTDIFTFWKLYGDNYIQMLLKIFQMKPHMWIHEEGKVRGYITYVSNYPYLFLCV